MIQHDRNIDVVLFSGGIESYLLVYRLLGLGRIVQPVYIRQGYIWEKEELSSAHSSINNFQQNRVLPIQEIKSLKTTPAKADHWSLCGQGIPGFYSADEEVFLPDRNQNLITTASTWCQQQGLNRLTLGLLKNNPFADSKPHFFKALQSQIFKSSGLNVEINRPFSSYTKAELIQQYCSVDLSKTMSCLQPLHQNHCGECNKCRERQVAFSQAGLSDPTSYRKSPSWYSQL